jgi:hypothetical protein
MGFCERENANLGRGLFFLTLFLEQRLDGERFRACGHGSSQRAHVLSVLSFFPNNIAWDRMNQGGGPDRIQSPRPETPEPGSTQGRRNAQPGVQLLDDEGGISDKVRGLIVLRVIAA